MHFMLLHSALAQVRRLTAQMGASAKLRVPAVGLHTSPNKIQGLTLVDYPRNCVSKSLVKARKK